MLFTLVDDEGRARATPRMLASLLFPYDDDAKTHIVEWMFELEREDAILLYEVDEVHYLQIKKWLVHQKIDKPSKSRLPAPSEGTREHSPKVREASPPYLGPRTIDQGPITSDPLSADADPSEPEPKPASRRNPYPEAFEAFWRDYPTDALMSKKKAFEQWGRLDQPSRDAAVSAVPAFKDYCKKNPTYRPVHAERFLRERRFDGFMGGNIVKLTPEQIAENEKRREALFGPRTISGKGA